MTTSLSAVLVNPQQAHTALTNLVWPWIKSMNMAQHRLLLTVKAMEDERTTQQNRFYWGPCLGDIAEQASIGGQKYSKDAWHELFKREFLPRKVTKTKVAGKKRPVVTVKLGSTTDLSVKKMSEFLEKVLAFATTDLGVQFTARDWQQPWDEESARARVIDPETGEILS